MLLLPSDSVPSADSMFPNSRRAPRVRAERLGVRCWGAASASRHTHRLGGHIPGLASAPALTGWTQNPDAPLNWARKCARPSPTSGPLHGLCPPPIWALPSLRASSRRCVAAEGRGALEVQGQNPKPRTLTAMAAWGPFRVPVPCVGGRELPGRGRGRGPELADLLQGWRACRNLGSTTSSEAEGTGWERLSTQPQVTQRMAGRELSLRPPGSRSGPSLWGARKAPHMLTT